jgi:DnaK suppressor protein
MTTTAARVRVDPDDVRALLQSMYLELTAEQDEATASVAQIGRPADRDGDDQIDAGAKSAQRDQLLCLVASIRERLGQVEHALERLDAGGYGLCEACHRPITTERLIVFPSATSCVDCKRADERRA